MSTTAAALQDLQFNGLCLESDERAARAGARVLIGGIVLRKGRCTTAMGAWCGASTFHFDRSSRRSTACSKCVGESNTSTPARSPRRTRTTQTNSSEKRSAGVERRCRVNLHLDSNETSVQTDQIGEPIVSWRGTDHPSILVKKKYWFAENVMLDSSHQQFSWIRKMQASCHEKKPDCLRTRPRVC